MLSLARSANLVRQPANPIAHTAKMPDNGQVRRPNPLVFEKSRLEGRIREDGLKHRICVGLIELELAERPKGTLTHH